MDAYLTSIRWPGTVSIHTAYEVLSIDLRAYINLDKLSTSSDQKGDPAAEIAVNNGQLQIRREIDKENILKDLFLFNYLHSRFTFGKLCRSGRAKTHSKSFKVDMIWLSLPLASFHNNIIL